MDNSRADLSHHLESAQFRLPLLTVPGLGHKVVAADHQICAWQHPVAQTINVHPAPRHSIVEQLNLLTRAGVARQGHCGVDRGATIGDIPSRIRHFRNHRVDIDNHRETPHRRLRATAIQCLGLKVIAPRRKAQHRETPHALRVCPCLAYNSVTIKELNPHRCPGRTD
ncbi:hypothetical protein D3C78_573940 [compost metagenome]